MIKILYQKYKHLKLDQAETMYRILVNMERKHCPHCHSCNCLNSIKILRVSAPNLADFSILASVIIIYSGALHINPILIILSILFGYLALGANLITRQICEYCESQNNLAD